MRMLAWVNLLQEDGYVNDSPRPARDRPRRTGSTDEPFTVIIGLVYGYVPFLILPLFAALDRIDQRVLEASRDLGMGPARTFWRVTLPMSRQGILAAGVITALPMMGDYYTADLLSGSPRTSMVGNQIEFYLFEGSQKNAGASLVVIAVGVLDGGDGVLPVVDRSRDAGGAVMRAITRRFGAWCGDPWRPPVVLATVTWVYVCGRSCRC